MAAAGGSAVRNQRTSADFKLKEIKVTREVKRDESYSPEWLAYPILKRPVEVPLSGRSTGAYCSSRRRACYTLTPCTPRSTS